MQEASTNGGERQSTDTDRRRRLFLNRRKFMMASGMLAGLSVTGSAGALQEETAPEPGSSEYLEEKYPGLRVYSPDPENAEAAARETYTSYITPREEHYIRNHYLSPQIDEDEWEVELQLGDETASLSMEEIKHSYSTESVAHTMQCSGNGRSFFDPEVGGNPWTFGAVGNTIWTGTPVSEVLEAYGADTSDGTWLMAAGGDNPEGQQIFARSIPMQKAMEDCLLAYEMNGSPMNAEHGFPVRLLVPGWMGNNNVKWLQELAVTDMMMIGDEWEQYLHWQQNSYRIVPEGEEAEHNEEIDVYDTWEQIEGAASGELDHYPYIYDQVVKSIIGFPGADATVSPREQDGNIEVIGVAWAGDDRVESVEVSADGGDSWDEAEFFGPDLGPGGWRQFRYLWDADPGEYVLYSRATDENGTTQPGPIADPEEGLEAVADDRFPWNQSGYACNAYEPHGVSVTVEE